MTAGSRRALLVAVLLVAPALAGSARAQERAAGEEPTAAELLELEAAARGERSAWDALVAFEVHGTLSANGRENEVRLLRDRAGRVRYERRYRGQLLVFVDDGERGWLRSGESESFEPLDAAAREQQLQSIDLMAPLPDSFRRHPRCERIADQEGGGGRQLAVLRLTPEHGLPLDLAIDPATGRAERAVLRYRDPEDGGTYEMQVFLLEDLPVDTGAGTIVLSGYQERDQGTSVTSWIPDRVELLETVDERELSAPVEAVPPRP